MGVGAATADTRRRAKGKGHFPQTKGHSMMDVKLRGSHDLDLTDDSYALALTDRLELILTLKDVNADDSSYALG